MNCELCVSYQAMTNDLNKKGFHRKYCPGCNPRGENCKYMGHICERLGKGLIRFCFECSDFPCKRLKALDKRYSTKYNMSMIENLRYINEYGIDSFLKKEEEKWRCPSCGGVVCCHSGVCIKCSY
jgi:hypothetical protein